MRKVNNDWTIKYKAKTYQILHKNFCPAKSTIFVKETFSGKVVLLFKKNMNYHILLYKQFLFHFLGFYKNCLYDLL